MKKHRLSHDQRRRKKLANRKRPRTDVQARMTNDECGCVTCGKPLSFFRKLGGGLVHGRTKLWRHERNNIWSPFLDLRDTADMVSRFYDKPPYTVLAANDRRRRYLDDFCDDGDIEDADFPSQ
jgi:hypothetical protein